MQVRVSEQHKTVARLLSEGRTYKEIQSETGLQQGQLQFMLRHFRKAFNCRSSVQLVATLLRQGVIQ